jgi:HPt (histidine-containing phosphotransfer) domain-containing protein
MLSDARPRETAGPAIAAASGGEFVVVQRSTAQASLLESDQIDSLLDVAGVDGVRDILAAFWRSTDELSADLSRCVATGECTQAARSAHALKGSAANVGALRLADAARDVEAHSKTGDLVAAKHALEKLASIYRDTRAALESHVDARA